MKKAVCRIVSFMIVCSLLSGALGTAAADTLVLPDQLKNIEAGAFEGDQSLDEVVLPEGVEEIYDRAFADSSVTRINLPDSLSFIASDAFENAPYVSFDVNTGSYAHRWLRDNRYILSFADDMVYEFGAEMAIVDDDDELGLHTDSFVGYFELSDPDWWEEKLSGDPAWQVLQVSGPQMAAALTQTGRYSAMLNVEMPSSPGTAGFAVSCSWDGMEVTGNVTVSYVYPDALPEGTNIPDYIPMLLDRETVLSLAFEPASYSFGNADRVGLENYAGQAEYWFEGHDLHIIPRNTGTFAADVVLYAGNMYIIKTVVFRVGDGTDALSPLVEASWLDCYTITWNAVQGCGCYTVSAYLDEDCTELYRVMETQESFVYFNTDVGTRYWFVVETADAAGNTVRSEAVTAQPIQPLPAPEDLRLELLDDGTVVPSWSEVEGAAGYRLYMSTETDVWSPDIDWYSFGGSPEDVESWDLWIDLGETLYLWVCADNGDGPNLRAFASVTRSREAAIARFTDLMADENIPETLYLTGYDFSPISTDGVTDPDELNSIQAFNASLPEFEARVTAYNAAVDELYAQLESAIGELGLTSLDVSDDSFGIVSDMETFSISLEAAELLENGLDDAVLEMIGDDMLQAAFEKNGVIRYVLISETGISVSGEPYSAKAVHGTRGAQPSGVDWKPVVNTTLSGLSAAAAAVKEYAPDLAKHLPKQWGKILDWASPLADAFGVYTAYESGRDDSEKLARIIAIGGHGHPTAVERLHPDSLHDAVELNALRAKAGLLATGDLLLNAFGAAAGLILLAKLVLAGGPSVYVTAAGALQTVKGKAAVFLANAAGLGLGAWLDSVLAEIERLDRLLHYDAFGAVMEEGSRNLISGVEILYNDIDYSVVSAENGMYEAELPTAAASLVFRKDGYYDQPEDFAVAPKELTRHDVVMRKKTMGLVTGTVKDQFGDPVGGVSVKSGLFNGVSNSDGTFSISLPTGSRTIVFSKNGYIDASMSIDVSEGNNTPLKPVMDWKYGVYGVITDESGPLAGAHVSFRKYALSTNGSWSADTDENGQFRHMLPPGNYTLTVSKNGCIAADMIHDKWEMSVDVPEAGIKEFDFSMVSVGDRYRVNISAGIPEYSGEEVLLTFGLFSWGEYEAGFPCEDGPTPFPFGFICVSESRFVTIHAIINYTVNGVLKSYNDYATVDLENVNGRFPINLDKLQ